MILFDSLLIKIVDISAKSSIIVQKLRSFRFRPSLDSFISKHCIALSSGFVINLVESWTRLAFGIRAIGAIDTTINSKQFPDSR